MKQVKNRFAYLAILLLVMILMAGLGFAVKTNEWTIVVDSQKSDQVYCRVSVKAGDELSFGWEHSFEHVTWNEYYTVEQDQSFNLERIAVGGFGAGIPAEMDCTYRYEDGLIYMEDIQGSNFKEFNWIHSTTQLKWIALNGDVFITGPDMVQRDRIHLSIEK